MRNLLCRLLAALAPAALALAAGPRPAETRPETRPQTSLETPVRIATFNIRYGTADDGENAWPHRREALTERLASFDADIIGLQEALREQLDEIALALPGHAQVGVGRDDGRSRGEHAAILVRTDRFAIDASGTFWLSDTPGAVGSADWGNRITRVCTWARLIDKATGRAISVYNAHLDHQSQPSRERSVELIAARIAARPHPGEPVVLMGDFNAGEDNPALRYLRGEADRASDPDAWPGHEPTASPALVDTYRALHPEASDVGTFCGFDPARISGEKIDHLLVSPGVRVLGAEIDRRPEAGRYPSDHFAVWAIIDW